jgi:prepilin-type N-terminal cleavage/methylation domain-containing protein
MLQRDDCAATDSTRPLRAPDRAPVTRASRAFTLVELMVVLIIIGIVLSILLPAIGGVRRTARQASTLSLMSNLSASVASFTTDENRTPGVYSPAEIGSQANGGSFASAGAGMSTMQNVMLDLAGGITPSTTGGNIKQIRPTPTSREFNVDISAMTSPTRNSTSGAVRKAYFSASSSTFASVGAPNSDPRFGERAGTNDDIKELPEVFDAFGQPILAWAIDERANDRTIFARENSDAGVAKFYWAQNGAFLNSSRLGTEAKTQLLAAGGNVNTSEFSLIGGGGTITANILNSSQPATGPDVRARPGWLEGLLGAPSGGLRASNATDFDRAITARGKLVFHSAGADAVFMRSRDLGGTVDQSPESTQQGRRFAADRDVMSQFDDILQSAGN